MDISGISNTAMPVMNPVSATADAAFSPIGATSVAAAALGRMDLLVQMLQEFSTAEVLMALMMPHSRAKGHTQAAHGENLAMATWGLAQAMQMAGSSSAAGGAFTAMPALGAATLGAQINIQG